MSGYFGGYWGCPYPVEEVESASFTHAIEWGRVRARHVVIRLRDDTIIYSAGDENPDPALFPEWPGEQAARDIFESRDHQT